MTNLSVHTNNCTSASSPQSTQPLLTVQQPGFIDASTSTFAKVKDAMLLRRGFPNWMPVSAFSKTRHSKEAKKV